MRSLNRLVIVLFLFLFSLFSVMAVPAAPSPYCQLIGGVVDVNYNLFKDDVVYIRVQEVSIVKEEGQMNCEELYPIGKVLEVNPVPKERLFVVAQKVKGNVHFSGDEYGSGVYFSDYEIISGVEINIFQEIFYKFIYLIK